MRGRLSFSIERGSIFVYCSATGRRGDRSHYVVRSPYPPEGVPPGVERIDSGYSMGAERFDIDLPDDTPEDLTGCRISFEVPVRPASRVSAAAVLIRLEIQGRTHLIERKIPLQVRGDMGRIRAATANIGGILQTQNVNPSTGQPGYSPPYVPVFPTIVGDD